MIAIDYTQKIRSSKSDNCFGHFRMSYRKLNEHYACLIPKKQILQT